MIYSCPRAGYLLRDFPLARRGHRFLFHGPWAPGAAPVPAVRGVLLHSRGEPCPSAATHTEMQAHRFEIPCQGRWASKQVELFPPSPPPSAHLRRNAAVRTWGVLSVGHRQTSRDSVRHCRRADLPLHQKFQVYFPLQSRRF